jgi:hypothetical protein
MISLSFKYFENSAAKNDLDISRKAIKARKPPGNRCFRDPQKSLFDIAVISVVALKILHFQKSPRYATANDFVRDFPEVSSSYAIPQNIPEKEQKELVKIGRDVDPDLECMRCNVMDVISQLHGSERKAFKTRSIFLSAAVAGDGRGFLGGYVSFFMIWCYSILSSYRLQYM